MKLVLKNKKEFEVTETSDILSFTLEFENFAGIDGVFNEITKENLSQCTINDKPYVNIIPVSKNIEVVENKVYLRCVNRNLTDDEDLKQQVNECQDAIATLVTLIGGLK